MRYFTIHNILPSEGRGGDVFADSFHPVWKEAAASFTKRAREHIEGIAKKTGDYCQTGPLSLEWTDVGLQHINLPNRGGLDLNPQRQCYIGHNLVTHPRCYAAVIVLESYFDLLMHRIEQLQAK